MTSRVITVSEGVGQLFGGELLLREVLYRLYRSVDDSGMVRPSEAIGPLEGTMDVGDMAEAVVLSGVEDLVLQLDDGRRITIALTSTSGRFQVRGVGPGYRRRARVRPAVYGRLVQSGSRRASPPSSRRQGRSA